MSEIKHTNEPLTENFRDRIATVDESGKRKWVYAYKPSGKFYSIRSWLSVFYFIAFFWYAVSVCERPPLLHV